MRTVADPSGPVGSVWTGPDPHAYALRMARTEGLVRRDTRLHVMLSENEADRLDAHVRATGTTRSDVLRRWIREQPLPMAEAAPLRWRDRPCASCGDKIHVREDIDGPYYCARHERRRPRIMSLARSRKVVRP